MSRLGKKLILIPADVTVLFEGGSLSVKGPKGELTRVFRPDIKISVGADTITLAPSYESVETRALWGTYWSHVNNMLKGVTDGYVKKLAIEGTGYKWEVLPATGSIGQKIKLAIGFSHPLELAIPEGLKVTAEKSELSISGIDKELVGSFAALIRSKKKPEPYKGKGIRYVGEVIERKQGKRSTV